MIIKLFLDWTGGYDAKVITLGTNVLLNEKVQIAQLPNENEECAEYGKHMVISGWGKTWSKGENNTVVRSPDVPMYLEQQCLNVSRCPVLADSPYYPIHEICVGDLEDARNSACYGDSGGKI